MTKVVSTVDGMVDCLVVMTGEQLVELMVLWLAVMKDEILVASMVV